VSRGESALGVPLVVEVDSLADYLATPPAPRSDPRMAALLVDRVHVNENNREPRQPLVLLVDTSGSMRGDLPDVSAGLAALRAALARDAVARNRIELALVTFGGAVTAHGDFGEAAVFEPPVLAAEGDTPMAAALEQALDLLEAKKRAYKESGLDYYRPLVFLLTDGEPTDTGRWPEAVRRVREAERARKIVLLCVGTGTANFARLAELSPDRAPLRLRDAKWEDMFQWLSRSVQARSRSRPGDEVPLEDPTGPRGWGALPS
jgi:uncharacterized protein YegL